MPTDTATTTPTLSITTERVGRRTYVRGATYPIRDALRGAGAHWDADEKAWWIGSDEVATAIAAKHAVPVTLAAPVIASVSATVTITGNTYPVKEQLRALGGRWNADAKGWDVPATKADEARALVAGAPVKPAAKYTPVPGGAQASKWRKGWRPCGYPGCSPNYCDECDGDGYVPASSGRRYGRRY